LDPDPHGYDSGSAFKIRIRIRIQEGRNEPPKIEKGKEISCFEVPDVLF
jgi:hypothetical protein